MKKYLNIKDSCKEHHCNINRKNIRVIYKPDMGLKKTINSLDNDKLCDCIIECQDDKLVIVEILCGKLTYSEYKDKIKQLENCIKIVNHCNTTKVIKDVVFLYDTIDKKSNQSLRKKLFSTKLHNYIVKFYQNKNFNGIVC